MASLFLMLSEGVFINCLVSNVFNLYEEHAKHLISNLQMAG